jgi:hypothetical protein
VNGFFIPVFDLQDAGEPVPRPEDPGLCPDVPVSHIPGRAHGCGRCARKVHTIISLFRSASVLVTINVPVVYMGRYEVVLRGDYP